VLRRLDKQAREHREWAEEAVRASEEQYRILFNSMEEGFCTIEVLFDENHKPIDYRFLEINPAFEKQTGLKDAKGKLMRELAHDHEQHWFDIYGKIALTGESARFENRAEALHRWYEVYAFRVGAPENRRVGIVFSDITERKRREEQMREIAERFRFLAESMPQKIFTAKPNGDVDYFNQQWMEFTGLVFEQIRDWGWLQFIHPDDIEENIQRWRHSIETGESFYMEHRVRRADGTYRWHVSRAQAMRDADGKISMWIGSNTDIDDVRKAKEQAERASHTKDEFLAALSHELRTPLTPVLMTAAELRDDGRLPLDARDQLAMMKRNIELEARLIDDLLDLTRIAHGKFALRMEPCDAHSLLALAVEMVRNEARAKRLTVEIDLRADQANVMGDPARLQQVFWNLLKNAVKFTPESGHVTVRSQHAEGKLAVEIADTGVGIAPEAVKKIFLPFEQAAEVQEDRRFGGLGLGLSISKAILDQHGAEIEVNSGGLGHGATFRVELPVTEASVPRPAEKVSSARADIAVTHDVEVAQTPLRVLLVEDNEATIQVLRRLLTRSGHHVTSAMTVAGAMQAAENGRFDVVISDLGLPDGTGFELMEELRNTYRLRGIAVSGYGMDEDLRRARDAGFAAHLIKPVDFEQLRQAVSEVVKEPS
jgi:PAS domain S-box-containing protein